MSDGELAFLALVIGSLVIFAVSMIWLRADYVKFREQSPSTEARLRVQMAE